MQQKIHTKRTTYLILTFWWGCRFTNQLPLGNNLNSRSTGKISGILSSSFTSNNNHRLNWGVRSSSFSGSIFHSLGISTLGFPGPQSHNRIYDTRVFLAQYQTEKCDRDPQVFLARSATHYSFGVNPRFSWPKIHSVKDHDTRVFLAQYQTENHDPRVCLARSATHYSFGMNPRFS